MRMSSLVPLAGGSSVHAAAVTLACKLLSDGNIIAIPTDTIYGFASNAQNTAAVRRLYSVKGRDVSKPIAVCVGGVEEIPLWGKCDLLPKGLLSALLPGPVTVVLERTSILNPELNPGTSKVGIRVPDHPFVLDVVQRTRTPLALTSANRSNGLSSLHTDEFRPLWPQLAAVFDGGRLGVSSVPRAGSTVVDLSMEGKYKIVRNGSAYLATVKVLEKFDLQPMNLAVDECIL